MRMTMLGDAKLITDIQNSTRIATRAKGEILESTTVYF